jgi:hypothetical protein
VPEDSPDTIFTTVDDVLQNNKTNLGYDKWPFEMKQEHDKVQDDIKTGKLKWGDLDIARIA